MTQINMGYLREVYYILNVQLDEGNTMPIDRAAEIMLDGELTDFVKQYDEMDYLGMWDSEQLEFVDRLVATNCIYDPDRVGVRENGNGFALLAANMVQIMTNHESKDPESGNRITPGELEPTKNWDT